jgi:hypothetical protein
MSPSTDQAIGIDGRGARVLDWTEGSAVMLVTMPRRGHPAGPLLRPAIFIDASPETVAGARLGDVAERCLLPLSAVAFFGTPEGEGKDRRLVWAALRGSAFHVTKAKAVRISG